MESTSTRPFDFHNKSMDLVDEKKREDTASANQGFAHAKVRIRKASKPLRKA